MKNYLLALVLASALATGGCVSTYNARTGQVTTTPVDVIWQPAPAVVQRNPKTLAGAEFAYQAAVTTIADALDNGALKPRTPTAQRVGDAIKTARTALDAWHLVPSNASYAQAAIIAVQALSNIARGLK